MIFLLVFVGVSKAHSQVLRVMAYNIHHGYDGHEKPQLKKVAELIRQDKADLVGLVEVDSVCHRSGSVDQPAVLAERTGMHVAFARHFAFEGGAYGVALLSRYPVSRIRNVRIPVMTNENGDTTRALLLTQLTIPGIGRMKVAVAHLDYRSEISRERQVDFLLNLFKDGSDPVMILGDLNAVPGSKSMLKLQLHFRDANSPEDRTYPADIPAKKIDYILVDKKHFGKTLQDTVYPVLYSDHRPISAELEFVR